MLWKFQGHLKFHHEAIWYTETHSLVPGMYQSVGPVEYGEKALMPIHEPLLHASLLHREQGVHPAELLEFQDGYAMRLGNPNTLSCE